MKGRRRGVRRALAAVLCVPIAAAAQLPPSALAVEVKGAWREWWRSDAPPLRWRAPHRNIAAALLWRPASTGIDVAELRLAGSGEAWRIRAIVVRIDPRRVALRPTFGAGDTLGAASWRVSDAASADIAFNAGQFSGRRPWGWVVRDGRELQRPGAGPLASALVISADGSLHIVHAEELRAIRASPGVLHAFQSYPALLRADGQVTNPLTSEGRGVDLRHRDARLAVGLLRDSTLIVVLTRFEGLGGALDILPFGLTTPEAAALMGALGCTDAMLLDGGISGQLIMKANGKSRTLPGLRSVPMGLVGRLR